MLTTLKLTVLGLGVLHAGCQAKQLDVLVVVIPEHGHISAIAGLSRELLRRGHKVRIAAPDTCLRYYPTNDTCTETPDCHRTLRQLLDERVPGHEFVSTGRGIENYPQFVEKVDRAMKSDPMTALAEIMDLIHLEGMKECVLTLDRVAAERMPDVLVADIATFCGVHAAERLGVPWLISSPTPLGYYSDGYFDFLHPSPFGSITVQEMSTFKGRVRNALDWATMWAFVAIENKHYNTARRQLNMTTSTFFERLAQKSDAAQQPWMLQWSVLGQEIPRPLKPNVFMVGPNFELPSPDQRLAPTDSSAEGAGALAWLDDPERRPVVYVSFGTSTRPDPHHYQYLIEAAGDLSMDVLLSVREDLQPRLPAVPKYVRVEVFVHQTSVLAHPNVKAFATHCGANSVTESLALGVPILGLPMVWDQLAVCRDAQQAGAGVCIQAMTPKYTRDSLREGLRAVALDRHEEFARHASTVATLLRFAGGPARAADIVELAAAVGNNVLRDPVRASPWWVRRCLDIYAVFLGLLLLLATILYGLGKLFLKIARRLLRKSS